MGNSSMVHETLFQDYLKALLAGSRKECRDMVQDLIDRGIDIKALYSELFERSMYRVGELWENNRITVANEHLATSITESLLNLVYPTIFATARSGRKAVVSCSANEYHQIGAKMVADIFELNGWDGYFLGANTPVEDMVRFIHDVKPDVVGLSLSILSNMDRLRHHMEAIRSDFPRLDLLIGGQAFKRSGMNIVKRFPGSEYIPDLEKLEKTIKGS